MITTTEHGAQFLAQAEACASQRDWPGAAKLAIQALALDNNNTGVLDKVGWYLSRAKQHRQAIKVYTTLFEHDPERALWAYMLGYQHYELQEWREAVTWFDRALMLYPTYIVALYRKGYAHTQLKDAGAAQRSLRACIAAWKGLDTQEQEQQAKHYGRACFQLGKLELDQGRSRVAEPLLEVAVHYIPDDPYTHYSLGKALLKNGKFAVALEHLVIVDKLKPRQNWLVVPLAQAYTALGQFSEAEAIVRRIPPRHREPYMDNELGKILLAQGRAIEARDLMRAAVARKGANHFSFLVLAQAYEACGETAAAVNAYQRAIQLRRDNYSVPFPEAEQGLVRLAPALPLFTP